MVMQDPKDRIIDALKASQLDLRAENRDLQARVAELEEALHHYERHSSRVRALAKVRGEALNNTLTGLIALASAVGGTPPPDYHRRVSEARAAIDMTPEEALAKERQGE